MNKLIYKFNYYKSVLESVSDIIENNIGIIPESRSVAENLGHSWIINKRQSIINTFSDSIDDYKRQLLSEWLDDSNNSRVFNINNNVKVNIRDELLELSKEYCKKCGDGTPHPDYNIDQMINAAILRKERSNDTLKCMHELWLNTIREPINYDETPPYVGLAGSLVLNSGKAIHEMANNALGLIKLSGAVVGDPNNLEGVEIPKFDFNNIVDIDFSTLYPSYLYGPFIKVKHIPWKKVRIMQQFENTVDCAIWDYQATYISVIIKGNHEYKEELKYKKRVANRMILQWKDHRAGKKKSVVNRKRRKK